jgi:RND family efflux transporter MFP subunit
MESGNISTFSKDIGDYVGKGEIIARLTNPEISRRSKVLQAKMDAKKVIYDRLMSIANKTPDLTTKQIVDEAKGNFLSAQAELNAVNDRLNYLVVRAPFSGIITKRYLDPGTIIQSGISNSNSPALVEIQQINPIRLVIPLPEANVAGVKKGTSVSVQFPELGGAPIEAKVTRTSGVLDSESKTMQLEIDLSNKNGKIKPGMYAKVSMQLESRKNVISLPVTAKYSYRNQVYLMAVKDNKVQQILLKKGLSNTEYVEVLNQEIDSNSLIIIQGKGLVKDGQTVETVLKN